MASRLIVVALFVGFLAFCSACGGDSERLAALEDRVQSIEEQLAAAELAELSQAVDSLAMHIDLLDSGMSEFIAGLISEEGMSNERLSTAWDEAQIPDIFGHGGINLAQ